MNPEFYMQLALNEAHAAAIQDEVPIGAVIVDPQSGEVVGKAHNLSESSDATAHAEILAIRQACGHLGENRLRGLDLYVTLEPCTMCAAAISFARIARLYIGAEDPKGGAVINGVKFYNAATCHHRPQVFSQILAEESSQLLKDFFRAKRRNKLK